MNVWNRNLLKTEPFFCSVSQTERSDFRHSLYERIWSLNKLQWMSENQTLKSPFFQKKIYTQLRHSLHDTVSDKSVWNLYISKPNCFGESEICASQFSDIYFIKYNAKIQTSEIRKMTKTTCLPLDFRQLESEHSNVRSKLDCFIYNKTGTDRFKDFCKNWILNQVFCYCGRKKSWKKNRKSLLTLLG